MRGFIYPLLENLVQYASSRHTYNTRYESKQNPCKPRPRTWANKFSYQLIDIWSDIPHHVKDLTTFSFSKEIKGYLLSEQYSKVTSIEILLLTIT